MSFKQRMRLTEADRRMYAAERLDNFRWISKIVASYSKVTLKDSDRVPNDICNEIFDIGQFAELVYSSMPLDDLLKHFDALSREGFPLEGYTVLQDAILESTFIGSVAQLPAAIFWRPTHRQIVVSICGTRLIRQAVQDVRFFKTKHSSGQGGVHTGFWSLYTGIQDRIKAGLRQSLDLHHSAVSEIVLTGHSMGGSIAYLLGIDLLSDEDNHLPEGLALKLVTFGMPRVGDDALVGYFHSLIDRYREKHGAEHFVEYSVRGYNDGVPALPPLRLGYRHFPKRPIYATGDHLYYIPHGERERTLFRVEDMEGTQERGKTRFPRGGHNYYGGRELERLLRRIAWLERSDLDNGDARWEERYLSLSDLAEGAARPPHSSDAF